MKERKPKDFIKTTSYRGGSKAMRDFIRQNLKYPKDALENRIEGTVAVKFEINQKGAVTSAKIKSGLGYGCDEEAIRLVKLLRFKPTKNRRVNVIFHKTINIHFRLKDAKTGNSGKISYTYVAQQKAKEEESGKKKPATYTYAIIKNSRS